MFRTASSFSRLWTNRPVLGFFSTAGEAGFAADGVALSFEVVPLRDSGAASAGFSVFGAAGMFTFVPAGCGVAGLA